MICYIKITQSIFFLLVFKSFYTLLQTMLKIKLPFLFFLIILVQTFWGFTPQNSEALCIKNERANLRKGPGTKHEKLWEVFKYMPFKQLGHSPLKNISALLSKTIKLTYDQGLVQNSPKSHGPRRTSFFLWKSWRLRKTGFISKIARATKPGYIVPSSGFNKDPPLTLNQ